MCKVYEVGRILVYYGGWNSEWRDCGVNVGYIGMMMIEYVLVK